MKEKQADIYIVIENQVDGVASIFFYQRTLSGSLCQDTLFFLLKSKSRSVQHVGLEVHILLNSLTTNQPLAKYCIILNISPLHKA